MREDGVDAEVGPVAVAGDHQVPGRVPARGGSGEQVAQPAEAAGHAGRVEGLAHGAEAEGERPCPRRRPTRAAASSTAPASCRARRASARVVRAQPARATVRRASGRAPARARRRRPTVERGRARCALSATVELGGVGVHASGTERRGAAKCKRQEITTAHGNLEHPEMSRQARKRRRRHNRSGATRILLVGGGVARRRRSSSARSPPSATSCNVAAVGARRSTTLHPILGGGTSQVFAADGTRLGFIQSDELRTPVGWERNPGRPQERDGRDRGPALLQRRRHRPHRHLPRRRQGPHPRRRRCRAARRSRCS